MSKAFDLFKNLNDLMLKYESVNFFLRNHTRFNIWVLSVTRFEEPIIKNFSFYYKNINTDISSQININNQIDLACSKKLLDKKQSDIDKRSTIITATDRTIKEFEIYSKIFKDFC